MGCADGSHHRGAALCLRRRNDTVVAGMAYGRNEHGKRLGIYDHGSGHEDHQSGCVKDCNGLETLPVISLICDVVFLYFRTDYQCDLTCK